MEISLNQLIEREIDYANVQRKSLYDDHTLALCHVATLNVWDRTKEVVKKIESILKLYRAQRNLN